MDWLTTACIIVGGTVMVAGGFAIAGGLLWVSAMVTGKYAWRTWNNLAGIYKLETMRYWFRRMEASGTHILRDEHDEKLSTKEA